MFPLTLGEYKAGLETTRFPVAHLGSSAHGSLAVSRPTFSIFAVTKTYEISAEFLTNLRSGVKLAIIKVPNSLIR
ncbi:hypothetical protein GCM10011389_19880 [Pontibacillus salipaludis]|uniref:Uncharacterized protein n=1 Tax=Pontibacillus salipaludis TaxID=1697394 RepID=A0ABQ1Q4A5_9BACI|nr:hypothetical protein GCM10011389_19880 [Pontibacillus salipaludis]